MNMQADIGPFLAIAAAVAWAIIKALSSRRADAEGWDEFDHPPSTPPHIPERNLGTPPPIIAAPGPYTSPIPRTFPKVPTRSQAPPPEPVAPKPAPPVFQPPPVLLEQEGPQRAPVGLEQAGKAYQRGASLQKYIEERFAAADRQITTTHSKPIPKRAEAKTAHDMVNIFRRPETTRQAFIASFVLNPPKALEEPRAT